MAKTEKGKKKKKVLSDKEKATKKAASAERAKKYDEPRDMFDHINTSKVGKVTVESSIVQIRGKGVILRSVTSTGSISETFLPNIKRKNKKKWAMLVEDKGSKSKASDEDEDEDEE